MAWAEQSVGIDEWLAKLRSNDPSLTSLHVFKRRRFETEDVLALCEALRANTTLTSLDTGSHALSPEAAAALGGVLRTNATLSSLSVGSAALGLAAAEALLEGLAHNRTLTSLKLAGTGLAGGNFTGLADAFGRASALEHLDLSDNPLGDEGLAALARGLHHITELRLQRCGIGAAGLLALAQALQAPPALENGGAPGGGRTLEGLWLNENPLGAEGAQAAATLLGSSLLTELDLADTGLGDAGCAAVAGALTPECGLRTLDLSRAGAGPGAGAALAAALAGGARLRALRLQGNALGDAGAAALAQALGAGAQLEELDLGRNQLGRGAAVLLRAAPRLLKLSLFAADLSDPGALAVAEELSGGDVVLLRELELSGCGIGTAGMERIFSVLEGFAAPALEMLVVGANPAVQEPDFVGRVEAVCVVRPDLDITWRAGDAAATQQL